MMKSGDAIFDIFPFFQIFNQFNTFSTSTPMEKPANPAAIETSGATMLPPQNTVPSPASAAENLCRKMCSEGLLTYVSAKLWETNNTLREELPNALKFAPSPSKLVLSSLQNFSRMPHASVLLLECFLLMDIDEIDETVKEEAEDAAERWRKRLIDEGGIMKASEMDARGLLLLIGGFGIPSVFRDEDVRDLLMVSNIRHISTALRRSNVLMAKIPEIIEGMVKHNSMKVGAVDVVYTLGVEKFSPSAILSSFLQEFKQSLKTRRWKSNGEPAVVHETNREELSTLKSVIECLEGHNVDPSKLIPRFRISERIISLENKADRNKSRGYKMVHSEKFDEIGLSKRFEHREAKRSRVLGAEQLTAVNHVDSQRPVLEGRTAGHSYDYSVSSSVLPRPSSIPETVTGTYSSLQAGSYARQIYNDQVYGWQGDPVMHGRSVSHNYGHGPSPQWQGSMGFQNTVAAGVGHQTSASYVYQFASTVPGTARYQNSVIHASAPTVNHHSSYLYPGTYYPQGMQ